MASLAELLASSLSILRQVQKENDFMIVKSSEISRIHLKRLVDNNFLKQIIKGWYVVTDPRALPGDSTAWYASFWNFLTRYANDRYGKEWCLSPEESLSIFSGSSVIPGQVIIRSKKANNNLLYLIPPTSIFNLEASIPERLDTNNRYGLNLYSLPEALVMCSPVMYKNDVLTMRASLAMIKDSTEVLKILADNGQTIRAGRLAGAFRNIGNDIIADQIINTMKRIGYDVREEDPFETVVTVQLSPSPYVTRLKLMWQEMRADVIQNFSRPKCNLNGKDLLARMEAQYKLDAYHSLSIEGYRVTDDLIERVKTGNWKPDSDDGDQKNALAARGYWQAFQKVKMSVSDIFKNQDSGKIVERDLSVWHQEMFMPCVMAGIIKPSDTVGYRNSQVYIRNSMHTPLNHDALPDAMTTLFELLREEKDASARAILGHFLFTYIHPFMDGNGRIGRFLMNVMFASGGYDWVIIPVEKREAYMNALEKASVEGDIKPFAKFISSLT